MQYAPTQGFNPYQGFGQGFGQSYQPVQPAFNAQVPQATQIAGRFVQTIEEITPQEVSMGSTPSLFPLADGSAIVAKQWANDGTIKTVMYSAERREETETVTLADIADQLSDMKDMLDSMKPKRTTTRKAAQDAED